MSKNRTLASLISNDTSKIKTVYTDSDSIVTSASLGVTAAAGTATYSSADTLPVSADNGDQALVTSTNRLYIYTNGGWYNIALINSTPYWSSEASSSYVLSTTGTSTVITILAVDSEGIPISYTAVADSDFNQIATITKDSDNGRTFTITPTDSENGAAVEGTGTVTFKASDGVNLVSTLSTFSISFKAQYSNYTTFLAKADTAGTDNQVDASTNTYTITESGNVTSTALSPYHPGGYSTYFDGTDDYITVTDSTDFDFGTGDFTMEGWYYATDVSGDKYILNFTTSAGNGHFGVNFYNGEWRVGLFNWSLIPGTGTTGIEVNAWHHFAWVRESGTMKFYIDGTQVGSDFSYSSALDCNGTFRIGTYAAVATYGEFLGYLRDIRIVKGTAVYTSSFTPPTETLTAVANTSLLTCHLPYIADGSSNNHTLTVNGNTLTKRFGPYDYIGYTKADNGGSVYFDGSGDWLSAPSANLDGGDWTIEFWYYWDGGQTSYQGLCGKRGDNIGWTIALDNGTTSTGKKLYWYATSPNSQLVASTPSIFPNRWHHIAFVRNGGVVKGYTDGVEYLSLTSDATSTANTFTIGVSQEVGHTGETASGYISDFRVVKGTAVYTSAFTPPTAPLTAITNTDLLTCTNKNDIWDTGSGARVSKVGNTTASNTQRKFATSSAIYFDGTGDEITTSTSESFNYGTGDFTWEAWVYVSSQGTYDYVFSQHTLADGLGLYFQGGVWKLYHANAVQITTSTSVSNNTWYHVALARESGTVRLFIDGTLAGSATITASIPSGTTYGITLGRWTEIADSQYFHGYMQDVRITNGLARYTANFTPPTTEFTA